MLKKLLRSLLVIFLGLAGGMLWQLILLPYLAEGARTREFWFVRNFEERKVVVYPHKETIIQENQAITEAVKKVESLIVSVESRKGAAVLHGSGLILTSNGLAITLAELLPKDSTVSVRVDGEQVGAEILKKDFGENLAILQLKKGGLPTCGFNENVEKGEMVFLVGADFTDNSPAKIVNQGIVKRSDREFIYTNIIEKSALIGSVLFDVQGRVLGLNKIGLDNEVITIPSARLRAFAGL